MNVTAAGDRQPARDVAAGAADHESPRPPATCSAAPGERVLAARLRHVVVRRAEPSPSCASGPASARPTRSAPPSIAGRPPLRPGGRVHPVRYHDRGARRAAPGCRPAPAGSRSTAVAGDAGRRPERRPAGARLRRRAQRRADPVPDHRAGPGPGRVRRGHPASVADGRAALRAPLPADPADIDHLVFLGTGWTVGLAHEAALKVREAAQAWSESYPAMDFRHGPIAVAGPRSLVWSFGDRAGRHGRHDRRRPAPRLYHDDLDPLAQLVLAQRFATALAAHRGLDPDQPRLLTRSVILAALPGYPRHRTRQLACRPR